MVSNITKARLRVGLEPRRAGAVILRPLTSHDCIELYTLLVLNPNASWERRPADSKYARELLGLRLSHYERYGFGVLAVVNSDGALLGQAGIQVFNYDLDLVEIVVFLANSAVGFGLGTSIVTSILSWTDTAEISPLTAAIRDDNAGAQRFFRRFGFELKEHITYYGQSCGYWSRVPPK